MKKKNSKIKSSLIDPIEKTKNSILNFVSDFKKNREKQKIKYQKDLENQKKRDLLLEKKLEKKAKLDAIKEEKKQINFQKKLLIENEKTRKKK